MKFGEFHFGDGALFGEAIKIDDGTPLVGGFSYLTDGVWSYSPMWSYPRTFAVEKEHFRARQVILTSYLSYWYLNAVTRGVDGTESLGHPTGVRVVPVSWGTLVTHPEASGFKAYHLDASLEPWIGQIATAYVANRRHILSCYAWIDEASDPDGTIALEADWGSGELSNWDDSNWNDTWDAQWNANLRRMSPDGEIEATATVPAGMGIHRFWVTIPPKKKGFTLRVRIRAASGSFYIDRVKLEAELPLDVGQATSAGENWLEDSDKTWTENEFAGKQIVITSGSKAPLRKTISSNTHNRIYITDRWTLSGDEMFEITELGSEARPSAYVDEGLLAGWMQDLRAENIGGGLLTLGGPTVSQGVGGARIRVLDGSGNTLITIGENISDSNYRGIDLQGGSGIRIAAGSGGEIEIGSNIKISEEGYFAYNADGARTVWLKSDGGFTLATGSEWKKRLEFDSAKGFTFYDDANVPFVSFNPDTGTVYLGKEYQNHIEITPDAVTIHGSLIVASTLPGSALQDGAVTAGKIAAGAITADKLNVSQLSAITADLGLLTAGEIRLGTGTPDVDFTGLRLYKSGSTYRLEGQNSGTLEAYFDSDGKLYCAGGDIRLDSAGIIMGVATPESGAFAHFAAQGEKVMFLDAYSTLQGNTNDIRFRKSASDTIGQKSQTGDGEQLGTLRFAGVNSSSQFADCVVIMGIQDGAAGATYVPGAFTVWTSTASADWTQGKRLTVGSEGIVTLHAQSTCRAHLGTNQNIPTDTDTLVQIDTEDWDAQGEFDTTNHKFVAKKSGYYVACAGITYAAPVDGTVYTVQILKYDTSDTLTTEQAYGIAHASNTTHLTVTVSDVFHLQAGEALKLVAWHNAGSTVAITAGYKRTWLSVIKVA